MAERRGLVTLSNACVGGNPGGSATTKQEVLENYRSRNHMSGNTHGVAPHIYAALEYERLLAS